MTFRATQEGRLYLNGSSSKHVLGAIGWRRLAELSEDARCLLVSSATTAGLNAGLKSSGCPFRSTPVIAPSSPQSPPTPFYPSSHDQLRDAERRLLGPAPVDFFDCVGHVWWSRTLHHT
jgi:hypothetical protein